MAFTCINKSKKFSCENTTNFLISKLLTNNKYLLNKLYGIFPLEIRML